MTVNKMRSPWFVENCNLYSRSERNEGLIDGFSFLVLLYYLTAFHVNMQLSSNLFCQ